MRYFLVILSVIMGCAAPKSSQGEDFLSKVDQTNIQNDVHLLSFFEGKRTAIPPAFESLPAGSTRPSGWLLTLMQHDLKEGIVGSLDELYPGINADDLYRKNRRGGLDDVPEMGDLVLTGADWEQSIMWWNAETIGNWWDGFIRHAFLTGDSEAIEQSHAIVENLLDSQDKDGYIGIYKPNLRYQHTGSNGELWAQTTAFRTLLGYYELTKKYEVLQAIEKATAVTMAHYNDDGKNPFQLNNAFGGVTHGLMLTDVCEALHRITGKQAYMDYAVYLYKAFSTFSINRSFNDLRYPFLTQKDSLFTGHGVHTYEHLRTLINAYYQTNYPELEVAYHNALHKLSTCILPSGAGHGNEWIEAKHADASHTAAEFCTMLELRNSLTSFAQKTGEVNYADHAEKLTFNGMMGFRNADGTAITYGKHDNAYVIDGHHHKGEESAPDPRYKYSPTHSDPAVCCIPNYARNYPYYLDNMWMKKEKGLAALLYGPSTLTTQIEGIEVNIVQETNYPFSDKIKLKIKCDQALQFPIYLRKPGWASFMNVQSDGASIQVTDGYYIVSNKWNDHSIDLHFENQIQQVPYKDEAYFQRGPLVYAYAIPHETSIIKDYELDGFHDYYCFPTDHAFRSLSISGNTFAFNATNAEDFPWYNERTFISGTMYHAPTKEPLEVKLVPMGSTVLRRVTFPIEK